MKRSEMIEMLLKTSSLFYNQNISGPYFKDFERRFLDALLTTCEEAGMLPPPKNYSDLEKTETGYVCTDSNNSFDWDKED